MALEGEATFLQLCLGS